MNESNVISSSPWTAAAAAAASERSSIVIFSSRQFLTNFFNGHFTLREHHFDIEW
jgi:hypothetical protein